MALGGSVVGSISRYDRLVPVRVRFPDEVRFSSEGIASFPVALGPASVPVSHLAPLSISKGASVLMRENLAPAVIASAFSRSPLLDVLAGKDAGTLDAR